MGHPLEDYSQDILVQMYNLADTKKPGDEGKYPQEEQELRALEFVHDLCIEIEEDRMSVLQALEKIEAHGNKVDMSTSPWEVLTLWKEYWNLNLFIPKETLAALEQEFAITSVCREDLCSGNLSNRLTREQALTVSDMTMEHIAGKMADVYVENGFWDSLDVYLEDINEEERSRGIN